MIRKTMSRVLGCGCDGQEAELAALRREVQELRARLAERERDQGSKGPVVSVASYAQAAQAMAQGQRVALEAGEPTAEATAQPEPPAAQPEPGRRPVVELEDCIACGTCVEYSPEAFQLGVDGRALVASSDVPAEQVQEAMDACPTQCIRWED